jgi:hypothetical protein
MVCLERKRRPGAGQDWKESVQHQLRVRPSSRSLARRLGVKPKARQSKGLPSAKGAEHIRAPRDTRPPESKSRTKDLHRVEEALRQAIGRLPLGIGLACRLW